jgi:hypothetical protein
MLRTRRAVGVLAVSVGIVGLLLVVFSGSSSAGSVRSHAWAGYQAAGQKFRRVGATWTVPALRCSGVTGTGDSDSYVWVGLGSPGSYSERVGVREFCTGTIPAYVAFLEMNSLYEVQAIDPAPGDVVSASVAYGSGGYGFSLADSAQHKSFSSKHACGAFSAGQGICSWSTAVVGAGIRTSRLSALADYGRVSFSHIAITDATGRHGSFKRNRRWSITRFDEFVGTKLAASTSSLSHRGTRFTDAWHHL